ncbi:MAG TPA: helix-hairpin-helix domain-containing protein [Desulfuromonadaceae bacterium]|jgi:DNA uptake protein ComE-like DNA-binding protein
MKKCMLKMAMIAVSLLFAVNLSIAANMSTPDPIGAAKGSAKSTADSAKQGAKATSDAAKGTASETKAAAKAKIVNINSASEAELKAIPGIGDAYAAKIIAGRPYANKAQLKSRNILPVPVYEKVKDLIIAKQPKK